MKSPAFREILLKISWRASGPRLASRQSLNLSLQPRAFRLVLPLDNCSWRFTLRARVSCQPSEPLRPVHRCLWSWAGVDPARGESKERYCVPVSRGIAACVAGRCFVRLGV